jgi:DNA-directed RNA polymerase sigma subunit (sigma70/sigma32)
MSDKPPVAADEEPPEWWKRLTPEDQAFLRRIMGESWRPSGKAEQDVVRAFAETRRRIQDIEQRALRKLRGGGNRDDKK